MGRRSRAFIGAASVLCVLALQVAAFAGTGTLTPDHVTTNGQRVTITWSGMSANLSIWLQVCNGDTGANYNALADCSLFTAQERNASFNATGSGTTGTTGSSTGLNPDYPVLVGADEDLGWGCRSDGTAAGTVIDGIRYYNPCRVKISEGSYTTTTNEFFLPYTIDPVGTPIPEASLSLLLPVGAGLVLTAAFFIVRRRGEKTPARV